MTTKGLDSKDFRSALGSFATGVTIVTTVAPDGSDVGMTANSFNSVSMDPPLVLWSIGKNALSQPAFASAGHFAVHILASDQQALSDRFARRGEDKFAGLDLERGPGNAPLLADCAARFKCRTAYRYEGGDHDIIVGEVLEFDHFDKHPLVFHRGKYSAVAPATSDRELAGQSLDFLLVRAQFAASRAIRKELALVGIDENEYFALAALGVRPLTVNEMNEIGQFYDCVIDRAAIDHMKEVGLIDVASGKAVLTEKGHALVLRLLAIGKDTEQTMLEQFEPWEGQFLKNALRRIGSATPTVTPKGATDPE